MGNIQKGRAPFVKVYRYNFRYNRKYLYGTYFIISCAIQAPILSSIHINDWISWVAVMAIILPMVLWLPAKLSNADGHGIFYKDCVKIYLKNKEHIVKYCDIKKIEDEFSAQHLRVIVIYCKIKPKIIEIHQGKWLGSKNYFPLKKFANKLDEIVKKYNASVSSKL